MNREPLRRLRRIEGARAPRPDRPRIICLPPRSDGRPWTLEEEEAARSREMTTEDEAIHCSRLSHQDVEDRTTRELHRRIEAAKQARH